METQNNNQKQAKKPIVHLTQAAIQKVNAMMVKDGKEGAGLRVDVVTGGCAGLSYDLRFQKKPYDNDIVIEQDGLRLFVNPETVSFLFGTEIDYLDTLKESGFQYKNPNAQNSCGCGTSFS